MFIVFKCIDGWLGWWLLSFSFGQEVDSIRPGGSGSDRQIVQAFWSRNQSKRGILCICTDGQLIRRKCQ